MAAGLIVGFMGDHPRSRGVYTTRRARSASSWGSSPLARGLRVMTARHAAPPGIIPARAGFTAYEYDITHDPVDHPRSRGVYPG